MAKIKIHEIAKKIGLTSKEIIEKANELGINVKSHLSSIEDEQAEKIDKEATSKISPNDRMTKTKIKVKKKAKVKMIKKTLAKIKKSNKKLQ